MEGGGGGWGRDCSLKGYRMAVGSRVKIGLCVCVCVCVRVWVSVCVKRKPA